jgi:hypothetical protein
VVYKNRVVDKAKGYNKRGIEEKSYLKYPPESLNGFPP